MYWPITLSRAMENARVLYVLCITYAIGRIKLRGGCVALLSCGAQRSGSLSHLL